MKKILLLSYLFFSYFLFYGQNWQWKEPSSSVPGIIKDLDDNLYVISNSAQSLEIKKISFNGITIWLKTINGDIDIAACKIDPGNNLIILGNSSKFPIFNHRSVIADDQHSTFNIDRSAELTINISSQPPGIYFLEVEINGKKEMRKIMLH